MKLKLVAVAVTSILAVSAANAAEVYNKDGKKLDLYGKVTGLHYLSRDNLSGSDRTYVHFGFKGETKINDQLIGYGQWEYENKGNYNTANSSSTNISAVDNKTSLAFAGLKLNDFGSLDYGRNYGIGYDVASFTDVLPVYGGETWPKADGFMTGHTTGVVTYRNNNLFGLVDGLSFAAQYRGKNGHNGISESNRCGWGFSSSYEIDGFSVAAAYAKSDRADRITAAKFDRADRITTRPSRTIPVIRATTSSTSFATSSITSSNTTTSNNVGPDHSTYVGIGEPNRISGIDEPTRSAGRENAEILAAGIKYDADNIYLATTYSKTRKMTGLSNIPANVASEAYNFEAVAQYQLDFGLRPSLAYLQSKGRGIGTDTSNSNKNLVKYLEVGTTYYFNDNMSTYIDYKINLLNSDVFTKSAGIPTNNTVAVGMTYRF